MDEYIDKYFDGLYDFLKMQPTFNNNLTYNDFIYNVRQGYPYMMDKTTISFVKEKYPIIVDIYNIYNNQHKRDINVLFYYSYKLLKEYGKIYNIILRKEKLKKLMI